jgi:8-oxo-dGTP pyrophosphatase MutT (NUDIX family)
MPHIHTEPGQHDQTVSAYIIRTDFSEPKIMLHIYKKKHVLLQFGGHTELHENHWQAMARELKEEVGYTIDQMQVLQPKQRLKHITGATLHPTPACFVTLDDAGTKEHGVHFHTDTAFAFTTNQKPKLQIAEDESEDIRLFTKEELINIPSSEILENAREVCLFMFDEILPSWEPINTNTFTL